VKLIYCQRLIKKYILIEQGFKMDKYDGRYAFWERYEAGDLKIKRALLTLPAKKIMKDMVVPAKNYNLWESKLNILIDSMIKGYDILIEKKNLDKEEVEKDLARELR